MGNENRGEKINEVKRLLAKTTGEHGTGIYSDINIEDVKMKNQESMEIQTPKLENQQL